MAAEVNGIYGSQYAQPAELAASMPSAPTHASSHSVASTATSTPAAKPDPREVGWFFVEQYYTTLSKSPEKIHLFYSKRSQLVHGMEAEKVVPAVGGKAISEKIKSLDIQECKVRVLNVDSQASFQNIVVQVIGEISNKSEPHNKFVQTFVLAEQPNGYFVLNDIFRYLNIDDNEIVEDEPEQEQEHLAQDEAITQNEVLAPDSQELPLTEPPAEDLASKLEDLQASDEPVEPTAVAEAEEPQEDTSAALEIVEPAAEPFEEPASSIPAEEEPTAPEPTPAQSPPKAATPALAPALEIAPAKKTWANLVATKTSTPAVPALPVAPTASQPRANRPPPPLTASKTPSEAAAPSPVPATASSPTESNGWQNVDGSKRQARPQSKGTPDQVTLAYIKNVNEKVDARILKEALEKYGELKYFDVSRQRNCAFVEFAEPTSYAAAVASNPHDIGGEMIYVEERRPRPNAYGGSNTGYTRGRGGSVSAPVRGGTEAPRGRGGMNMPARSGSQSGHQKENGRGGFQQRGPRTGNSTPRGRGQAQAV